MDDNELILTESEKLEFMIKVTLYCSELSGIPVRYVARMFVDNDVYPYLCSSANLWITKTYRYMAREISNCFGLPLYREDSN